MIKSIKANLKRSLFQEEFFICATCSYCLNNEAACPVFREVLHERVTGKGKMLLARYLSLGGVVKTNEALEALRDGLFECTFCGACEQECLAKIPLMEVYRDLKSVVQEILPKKTKIMFKALKDTHNIYGLDQEERIAWSYMCDELYEKGKTSKSEIGYFIGCVSSYSGRAGTLVEDFLTIIDKVNEEIQVFSSEEWCCGNPFLLGGDIESAKQLMKHNVDVIKKRGIKTLVLSCAGCYRVFKNEYPKILGEVLPFNVINHSQYLLNLIKEKNIILKSKNNEIVTFKDPCELGRHCDIYEEPRKVLEMVKGIKLVEMKETKENAMCCGAGGLVKANHPDLAKAICNKLIDQVEETNAEYCINACPSCLNNIDQFVKEKKLPIKVIDIAQYINKCFVKEKG